MAFLVALAVEQLLSTAPGTQTGVPSRKLGLDALGGALVLAVFATGLVRNFRQNARPHTPWHAYASRIENWKKARSFALKNTTASLVVAPVSIPIQPFWYVCLPGTSIANGSFEDPDLGPWVPYGTVDAGLVKSPHYQGRQSVALRGADGGVYTNYADLSPFRTGTKLQVSAYAVTEPGGTGAALLWVSDTGKESAIDGPRPATSDWQKFTVRFIVSSTHSVRIHLGERGGSVYWDDVQVVAQ